MIARIRKFLADLRQARLDRHRAFVLSLPEYQAMSSTCPKCGTWGHVHVRLCFSGPVEYMVHSCGWCGFSKATQTRDAAKAVQP